jgi:hypothetical protein
MVPIVYLCRYLNTATSSFSRQEPSLQSVAAAISNNCCRVLGVHHFVECTIESVIDKLLCTMTNCNATY